MKAVAYQKDTRYTMTRKKRGADKNTLQNNGVRTVTEEVYI